MCLFHRVLLQTALLRLRSIKSVVIVKRVVHNECKCKRISRKNKCLYDFFVGLTQSFINSYDIHYNEEGAELITQRYYEVLETVLE